MRPGTYTLRTLVQTRWRSTVPEMSRLEARTARDYGEDADYYRQIISDTARDNDGLRLERVFLRATAAPTRALTVKVLVDFAELLRGNEKRTLKLAFADLKPSRSLTIRAGYFKIPFSLLELLPIAEYELADEGPTDDLIKDLGMAGRDIGALIDVAPLAKKRWLHVQLGIFRGESNGPQRWDVPGIIAARVTVRPLSHLSLGADCVDRVHAVDDWVDSAVPTSKYEKFSTGFACSADASFTRKHFSVRGEWMNGKRVDAPSIPDRKTHNFMAAWGVASYRFKLRGRLALLPAVRVEWLDEDRVSTSTGAQTAISAALNLEVARDSRLLFDLTRSNVQLGTRDRSEGSHPYRPTTTSGVVQLQIVL